MPDQALVGMIGRLEPVKGPEYFVQAAAEVTKQLPQTKFMMVGEGSLRVQLERQVKELGAWRTGLFLPAGGMMSQKSFLCWIF